MRAGTERRAQRTRRQFTTGMPHPRSYGIFAWALGLHGRCGAKEDLAQLACCIRSHSRPARRPLRQPVAALTDHRDPLDAGG